MTAIIVRGAMTCALLLNLFPFSLRMPAGEAALAQLVEWHPWHEGETTCSGIRIFFSLSKIPLVGGKQSARLKIKNPGTTAIEVAVSPQFVSDKGQTASPGKKSVKVNAGSEGGADDLIWTPFSNSSTAPTERVVKWGVPEIIIRQPSGSTPTEVTCKMDLVPTPVAAVSQTVNNLKAIPPGQPTVPPAARPLLTSLKKQLRNLFIDAVNSTPAIQPSDIKGLRASILEELKTEDVTLEASGVPINGYGSIIDIAIEQLKTSPDFLAAVVTLRIPQREDNSLSVIGKKGGEWAPVFVYESNDYELLTDGQGALKYAVSPTAGGNDFFVVIVDLVGADTSAGENIRYKVLRPGNAPGVPEIIGTQIVPNCTGEPKPTFAFTDDPARVILEFASVSQTIGVTPISRPQVRYALIGGAVVKEMTIEQSAVSFLDSWVALPSTEAGRWILSPSSDVVACRQEKYKGGGVIPSEHSPDVRQCPANPCEYQTRLSFANAEFPGYITIIRKKEGFFVEHVTSVRPSSCKLP